MLRRHLKQGGVPVTPCAGFDADAATAYLERALTPAALTRFESHLASCAMCRRQVVALARLAQSLEAAPVEARPAPIPESLWSRWQQTLAQWLDVSAWNWNFNAGGNAGWALGASACALLFAGLAASAWWQTPSMMVAYDQAPAGAVAPAAAAPEAFDSNKASALALNSSAELPAATSSPFAASENPNASTADAVAFTSKPVQIPRPVTPSGLSLVAGFAAPAGPEIKPPLMEFSTVNPGVQPPLPVGHNVSGNLVSSFNQPASNLAVPVRLNSLGGVRQSAPLSLFPAEPEQKELVAELVLPEPRRARERGENSDKPANEQSKAARDRELFSALRGRAFGFMPSVPNVGDKNAEARTKEADVKDAQAQTKPLMKRLNGHVFYFDHGFWIDEEYTSESKLPLKRLTRGSQEYQQTLIENPSLEQFFQLNQVIVVWKGVVYEVRK